MPRDHAERLKRSRREDDRPRKAVLRWPLAALAVERARDDGLPARRIEIGPPERGEFSGPDPCVRREHDGGRHLVSVVAMGRSCDAREPIDLGFSSGRAIKSFRPFRRL